MSRWSSFPFPPSFEYMDRCSLGFLFPFEAGRPPPRVVHRPTSSSPRDNDVFFSLEGGLAFPPRSTGFPYGFQAEHPLVPFFPSCPHTFFSPLLDAVFRGEHLTLLGPPFPTSNVRGGPPLRTSDRRPCLSPSSQRKNLSPPCLSQRDSPLSVQNLRHSPFCHQYIHWNDPLSPCRKP